jgi:hypothetical protein
MIPGVVDATSESALETRNIALTSTFVVQGSCTGVVFAIGDKSVMGRIVAMSGDRKFKLTTVQKEVWFFTKIISGLALSFFCIAMLVWGVWLRTSFPGFENASGAIINSIGCLTAFVPQVNGCILSVPWNLTHRGCTGTSRLCRLVTDHHRQAHGETQHPCQEPCYDRDFGLHVYLML